MKRALLFPKISLVVILLLFGTGSFSQIPSGYYASAAGKTGETLQIALYNIIKGHTVLSYTPGVWNAFYKTDLKANGQIWDMYTDIPGGTPVYVFYPGSDQCGSGGGGIEGDCYSREHSFPKSYFNELSPMNTDLFHIFPTDQYINNMHSNYPMAKVGTATASSSNGSKKGNCVTPGYTGTVFEPIDAYKGDFARAYFYMATRYENVIASWYQNDPYGDAILNGTSYPAFEAWYIDLLISWHNLDPVSPKEIARNDSIYKLQYNRNPYIDHPEYVAAVWGSPGPKPEPTSHVTGFAASAGNPSYNSIKLDWSDAGGTVIPDGYLVRGSTVGYASIVAPVDGTAIPDGGLDKNTGPSVQTCTMTGLASNTIYYFKIFPYTNSGTTINYKVSEPVPAAADTTTTGISVLQPGDIAIIEYGSVTPDKFSFIAFKQLNAGTKITFTDNGFNSPTTVRVNEGFLIYTAPTVIPAGSVISWYNGMNITGTGWNSANPSNFAFSESGDQLFAYQGTWGTDQSLIFGMNAGNSGWITTGTALSTTSYFPAALTNEVNSLTFPEKNGQYNLITTGTINALGSLISNSVNWTRSNTLQTTPSWSFTLSNTTSINQPATVFNMVVGNGEFLEVQTGTTFTVTGNLTIY